MTTVRQNKNILTFYLLILATGTVPVNISFFSIIRISDIFIIIIFAVLLTQNIEVDSKYVFVGSAFYGVLLLSTYLSLSKINDSSIERIIFFYKYSLLFLIPLIVTKLVLNNKRLRILIMSLNIILNILVAWVYIYFFLRSNEIISGHSRVSYPFSNFDTSDAHVYSSSLSFLLIAYIEYIRRVMKHGFYRSYIKIILGIIALFMTGSKTGVLIIILYLCIQLMFFINNRNKYFLKFVAACALLFTLVYNYLPENLLTNYSLQSRLEVETLFFRATHYNPEDHSITARIKGIYNAIEETEKYFLLLGNGPIGAPHKWYDGGFSILLAHSGIIGIVILFTYFWIILLKLKIISITKFSKDLYKSFVLLLIIYIILGLITEHFLLTRHLLPGITLLSIIYVNIKIEYENNYIKYKYDQQIIQN